MKQQEALKALRSAHAHLIRMKRGHPLVDAHISDEYHPEVLAAKQRLFKAVCDAMDVGLDPTSILNHLNQS